MCLFFISLLRNSFRGGAVLDVLAQFNSFAIFFLHPYFLVIFSNLLNRFYSAEPNSFIVYILSITLAIILSILIAMSAKELLRKRSRYFIGY